MIYGAISTDIKKSSVNWELDPEWMKKAVQYTNNITEYVFDYEPREDPHNHIEKVILPNSPEGDAYTLYYRTDHSENDLRNYLHRVASLIQFNLALSRGITLRGEEPGKFLCGNSTKVMKDKFKKMMEEELQKKEPSIDRLKALEDMYKHYEEKYQYVGNIYLRIGIAISDIPPTIYYYNQKKSWRDSVIYYSEKAEEQAPWKTGFGEYVDGKVIECVQKQQTYQIDRDIITGYKLYSDEPVDGYMVFIEYHLSITKDMVIDKPHLYELRRKEFTMVHDLTITMMDKVDGKLVKIKRDYSSMYYVPMSFKKKKDGTFQIKDDEKIRDLKQSRLDIIQTCSELLSMLPSGSSVGICYSGDVNKGDLKQVIKCDKNNRACSTVTDYFGPTVNMAARMASADWKYGTSVGKTVLETHGNRIAYADKKKDNIQQIINESEKDKADVITYPFKIDKVPLITLNAGYSGDIFILSKHLHGESDLKVGAKVKKGDKTGTIEEMNIFTAVVLWEDKNKEEVKLRDLEIDKGGDHVKEHIKNILQPEKTKKELETLLRVSREDKNVTYKLKF